MVNVSAARNPQVSQALQGGNMAMKRKIEISQWATDCLPGNSGLVIGGRRVPMGKKGKGLLMHLHKEMGRVVPHDKLRSIIGSKGVNMQALRVHIVRINSMLATRKIPLAVTAARGIGYALCEIVR
jgi:DNA-binding winged helix-turn-helix (wHTH) protein